MEESINNFTFWWSIVSTIIGMLFLVANVGQLVAYLNERSFVLKEKEIHKNQVKVWQHHAYGIQMSLFLISQGKFSTVDDMRESIRGIQQNANSLYVSLNEERLFTDEEIKEKQIQQEKDQKDRLKSLVQPNKNLSHVHPPRTSS